MPTDKSIVSVRITKKAQGTERLQGGVRDRILRNCLPHSLTRCPFFSPFNPETISLGVSLSIYFRSSILHLRKLNSVGEMTDQKSSLAETQPLLSEDFFQNDQSRRLFEAIDELRSCGANHDIELPEVRRSCI